MLARCEFALPLGIARRRGQSMPPGYMPRPPEFIIAYILSLDLSTARLQVEQLICLRTHCNTCTGAHTRNARTGRAHWQCALVQCELAMPTMAMHAGSAQEAVM